MGKLRLFNKDWDVRINPTEGGIFESCRFKQYQVFRDRIIAGENEAGFLPMMSGNFPLHPYSNRIEHGRFEFQGTAFQLANNAPGTSHPLHGLGWINPWHVAEQRDDFCLLTQSIDNGEWPWAYQAGYKISISDVSLRLELEIINMSEDPMPCGIGFHPYFPNLKTASLSFDSDGVWLCDEDQIPTTWVQTSDKFDFAKPRELTRLSLDHCFTQTRNAKISWHDKPFKIDIRSSENLSRAAVYIDQTNNSFCFEPISHTHNALNMADPVNEGITILAPGESVSCWSEFTVEI